VEDMSRRHVQGAKGFIHEEINRLRRRGAGHI